MKKLLIAMLTGCMMLAAAGCAKTGEIDELYSDGQETSSDEAPPERTAKGERLAEIQKSGTLLIGISPDYAPFAFEQTTEEGETFYAGADIEFGRYLAKGLNVEPEFLVMEFDECLEAVQNGEVDLVLLGMLPKEERTAYADFTDCYYEPGEQVFLIRKTQEGKYRTLNDLAGRTVQAQYGSLQAQLVAEQLPESQMELSNTAEEMIFQLRIGKADAAAIDRNLAERYLEEYEELTAAEAVLSYESEGVVAGVVKGETVLLDRINELIQMMNEEHLYVQWLDDAIAQAAG